MKSFKFLHVAFNSSFLAFRFFQQNLKKVGKIIVCFFLISLFITPSVFAAYGEVQVDQEVTGAGVCNNNGVCEAGETFANCPTDCPATTPGGPGIIRDTVPPVIFNLSVGKITLNSAEITWETNKQALCKIFWGKSQDYENGASIETAFFIKHSMQLSQLSPTTIYHFKISCADTSKNESETTDQAFSTLSPQDTTPPANVSNFEAIPDDGKIDLKWKNPPDADLKGVRLVRNEKFFPSDIWDGAIIYDGQGEQFTDAGLQNGARYYYTAFAYDKAGNFSSGAIVSAVPKQAAPPEGAPVVIPPLEIPVAPGPVPEEVEGLKLTDFEFWQEGRKLEIVGEQVKAVAEKPVTVLINYNKVPEVLKTIMITLLRQDSKSFSFLLRINKDKSAYTASILLNDSENYPVAIQVLDYKNQRLKKINGQLEIEKAQAQAQAPVVLSGKAKIAQYIIYVIFIILLLLLLIILILLAVWLMRKMFGKKEEKEKEDI